MISSRTSTYAQKLKFLNFLQCLHQLISQTYVTSKIQSRACSILEMCLHEKIKLNVESKDNVKKSFQNPCSKLAVVDFKSKVKAFIRLIGLCVNFPLVLLQTNMLLFMPKYHCYKILVDVSQNILPNSILTSYCSPLTANMIALPTVTTSTWPPHCL